MRTPARETSESAAYLADGATLCLACVDMRYQRPHCDACHSLPRSGWWAIGRRHRDCPGDGHFNACDDRCEPIGIRRTHTALTCALCESEIPPTRYQSHGILLAEREEVKDA